MNTQSIANQSHKKEKKVTYKKSKRKKSCSIVKIHQSCHFHRDSSFLTHNHSHLVLVCINSRSSFQLDQGALSTLLINNKCEGSCRFTEAPTFWCLNQFRISLPRICEKCEPIWVIASLKQTNHDVQNFTHMQERKREREIDRQTE